MTSIILKLFDPPFVSLVLFKPVHLGRICFSPSLKRNIAEQNGTGAATERGAPKPSFLVGDFPPLGMATSCALRTGSPAFP